MSCDRCFSSSCRGGYHCHYHSPTMVDAAGLMFLLAAAIIVCSAIGALIRG